MTLTNREIADVFDAVADMLELKGEIIHRIMSYRRAAESVRNAPRDLRVMADEGKLKELPGIGDTLAEKIVQLLDTGEIDLYNRLKEEIPPGVVEVLHVNGVGPKKAVRFWKELGITSVKELEAAARAGKLRDMSGMGAKSEQRILESIEALSRRTTRTPLYVAYPIAHNALDRLLKLPGVKKGMVGGSIGRGRPTIGDVDLVVAADDPVPLMEAFTAMPGVARVLNSGKEKTSVELLNGLQMDLTVIPEREWGTGVAYFTGSQAHNIRMRARAAERGYSLNEHAMRPMDENGNLKNESTYVYCATEEQVYEMVGLPWIPPELREDRGEFEAADAGKLPNLITLDDLRADLHMHTTWSDGALSIHDMAEAALARGRKFIVITDHSRSLGVANGLSIERLMEQQQEVRRVDAEMGGAIRVFHGTEMEITADGRLDYPDDVLEKLDFVIASLHVSLRQPREVITPRLLNAINNPHVDLIAHPRGQLIPDREPADLDMDAVFEAARKSGIALEINANPHRLDLEAQYARRAVELGIPLAINTDAHRAEEMDLLHYGVTTARRGWVEAPSVLNTWSLDRFLDWVQQRGKT